MKTTCSICSIECSGKYKINARKNKEYPVCKNCFNRYELTDLKEVRKLIYKVSL